MKKAQAGFTLIELVIVIIIVAILAAASVPIYRNYVRRAVASEGTALAGSVLSAARMYFTEHQGTIANFTVTQADADATTPILGVNSKSNKYFTTWTVTLGRPAATWQVTAGAAAIPAGSEYAGLRVGFTQNENEDPKIVVSGAN